jgi:multidrug efflux pump subunit AcrB
MGIRSALTVGIALPLSAAMVLVGMQVMNIPLHQMSVTGLIISLGLLIDNAIVVVEDYKLRRGRGAAINQAISAAIKHLFIPLGASTATTVFAFMPIALAPGGVGDFTGTLGVTVALSVISSFILAMTVVPAFAGYLDNKWPSSAGGRWWQSGFSSAALTAKYRKSLITVISNPALGIGIACVLPVLGFSLAHTLTQQFFPAVDRNQFQVQLSLPAQTSIWETQQATVRADKILRSNDDVTDTFWSIGKGAPRVYYNVVSLNERVPSFAAAWVNTTSPEATGRILGDIQNQLSIALPDAEVLATPFEQGPPSESPIEIRIIGPDLGVLSREALKLRAVLAGMQNITYAMASLSTAEPKLTFTPKETAAAATGITTGDLARKINSALMGDIAGTVLENNTEIKVRVKFADQDRDQMSDLNSLPILTNANSGIPLSELGDWKLIPTASSIDRRQGERLSAVKGYITPFSLPGSVLADFLQKLDEQNYTPPQGYRLQVGGEAENSAESINGIVQVFVFFVLAMIGIIILSLNSFRYAGMIGFVAILSFGLALLGVRIFGYPFGYMALIGSLGMMGLAINGAIIVVSALKADPRSQTGDSAGIAEVVIDASRHIISTTFTTIGGFVPLIVNGGEFWPPLATAIAGGVVGSAVIALYMVPSIFAIIRRSDRQSDSPFRPASSG